MAPDSSPAVARKAGARPFRLRKPCCEPAGAGFEGHRDGSARSASSRGPSASATIRIVPIALIVFAVGASACAYLWVNHGDQVRTAVFAIPSATGSTVAASREQPVSRADFDAFERQMADTLRSMTVHLDAQQADLKRLADQVAALSAKVETTQGATSSIPAQTPVAPVATPAPPRPPTIVQRRKPAAPPKSTGPISTGGAPLPPDR
jgi:hypothetical protein